MTDLSDLVTDKIAGWLSDKGWPLIVGVCGAQGSGKSTLCETVAERLNAGAIATGVLSIDDLYLAPEDRPVHLHPLFATRGVPGTHDPALGAQIIDDLRQDRPIRWPRFDKASDRPVTQDEWQASEFPFDVLLFEGWCVGAVAQDENALSEPVNALERDEDPEGVWRRHVNAQLAVPYADLFVRLDKLILLEAPGFEVVHGWRTQQEEALRRALAAESRPGARLMDEAAITRFIQHYERLTRHILSEMPARADLCVRLGPNREVLP